MCTYMHGCVYGCAHVCVWSARMYEREFVMMLAIGSLRSSWTLPPRLRPMMPSGYRQLTWQKYLPPRCAHMCSCGCVRHVCNGSLSHDDRHDSLGAAAMFC